MEFKVVDRPVCTGKYDALVTAVKSLPDGKALQVKIESKTTAQNCRQAIYGKVKGIRSHFSADRTYIYIWRKEVK